MRKTGQPVIKYLVEWKYETQSPILTKVSFPLIDDCWLRWVTKRKFIVWGNPKKVKDIVRGWSNGSGALSVTLLEEPDE